jgi:hypothetical protein
MSRLVMARTILAVIGVAIWGYGYRIDDPNVRLAGILVLAATLVLRFVPRRWFGE